MQIEDRRIEEKTIGDIGFINTNLIDEFTHKFHAKETEANLLQLLLKIKTNIKYSFLTTSSECYCLVHIRFPLLLEVIVM